MNNLSTKLLYLFVFVFFIACQEKEQQGDREEAIAKAENSKEEKTSGAVAFEQAFDLGKVKMMVHIPNTTTDNLITINPEGFENMKDPFTTKIEGIVREGYQADLNGDGFQEIYLFEYSIGSGTYGKVHAFASFGDKSFGPIYMPEMTEDLAQGYMGHDRFYIKDDLLVREFPLYNESDTNAKPTGGNRVIKYSLEKGEAGFILKPKKGREQIKLGF
ncbi:hypothetical protein [Persicobacter sp. CCB-QB2]|uniref:hypothetical protein n=1 Tax=Persicobacter sp. CCB-QB2 TaxID=1561025 RepID=UPI0012F8F96A|nr:hypothetical protein [Persicobacter sp. CCB-QB2]